MVSFCQCEMCKEVEKKNKYSLCKYCNEYHDWKTVCSKQVIDIEKEINTITPKDCTYYLELENGKYTVYIDKKTNAFKALRHGEPWRDLCGDNLIFYLMIELIEANSENSCLQDKIAGLEQELPLDKNMTEAIRVIKTLEDTIDGLEHELTLDEWERKT